MSLFSILFLDLTVEQKVHSGRTILRIMNDFENRLSALGVTLPTIVKAGELQFRKPGTTLVRAYYSSNAHFEAVIEKSEGGNYVLRGSVAVTGITRMVLQVLLTGGSILWALLILNLLARHKFQHILLAVAWEPALIALVFLMVIPNYFVSRRQRTLIKRAFTEAAQSATESGGS